MTAWQRQYDGRNVQLAPFGGLRPFHGMLLNAPGEVVQAVQSSAQAPFVGLTTDGNPSPGLYSADISAPTVKPVVDAARTFLDLVDQLDYRQYVQQPFDSWHRRSWFNAAPVYIPAGVLLDDMRPEQREAALAVVKQCLSPAGYDLVRKSMLVNEAMGQLFNIYTDTFREWAVWFTIFGTPSEDQPWGWQLMGTHIDINCTVVDGTVLLEPLFLGAELREIKSGQYEGLSVYDAEQDAGLALGRTLNGRQRDQAILHPSMLSADLPAELGGPVDGRHIGGAGRDNEVVPYAGVSASEFTSEQRALLLDLIEVYLARLPEERRGRREQEVRAHLDETHVAWIGDPEKVPFYYRVHSPTIWIEFDHHPALMLEGPLEPTHHHVHTIMRAPNGGDYGMALMP
ncbi:DUF3500 domain-containing protein [Streptomyces griseorubiginosus]|uniref:DUF3500 domain-containing protein n=1 Tax=Streptomyces griseorubiginosus TaxID=67304 RepID=UPI001AD6609C|nr:DUF3500 domain-containing protein [Streptomyces griseorubiginosus]MBO4252311.1 DUF3500 domain-containing protein [Streptomyces griseorubiginosus]